MNYNLTSMSVGPLTTSKYIQPMEIHYTLNGIRKKWDYIGIHNSVVIIIFNVTRKVFVCVKQFRPTVYINRVPMKDRGGQINLKKYPVDLGVVLEFCAGITDKDLTNEEIAQAEILEETGYNVPLEKLQKVRNYRSNVSAAADDVHMYYVEVEDHMRTEEGGGIAAEGEFIEVVDIPLSEAKKICEDPDMDKLYVGLIFGFLWFFHFKAPALKLV